MKKDLLLQILDQNRSDCVRILKDIHPENKDYRLTNKTASAGFIYRHIGESTNLIGQFFGYTTDVEGTTMNQLDMGRGYDLEESRLLFEEGYTTLKRLVDETADDDWFEEIETDWFGKLSRIRIFSITLSHNAHHCGQIASALVKGKAFSKESL